MTGSTQKHFDTSSQNFSCWTENAALQLIEDQNRNNPFFQNKISDFVAMNHLHHYTPAPKGSHSQNISIPLPPCQVHRVSGLLDIEKELFHQLREGPGPLGLKLEKSPTLVSLIEKKLNPDHQQTRTRSKRKLIFDYDQLQPETSLQKLKASIFSANPEQSRRNSLFDYASGPVGSHQKLKAPIFSANPERITRSRGMSLFDYASCPAASDWKLKASIYPTNPAERKTRSRMRKAVYFDKLILDYGSKQAGASDDQKMKALTTPATVLRIGSWERVATKANAVAAKCYFARRMLVWETLEGEFKKKIEIRFSDIIGINAPDPSVLNIELSGLPCFYEEMGTKPRRQTMWRRVPDFTGGQASICRRHQVMFRPGDVAEPYQQLLRCDERLNVISRNPFPSLKDPYFPFYPALTSTELFSLYQNRPVQLPQNPLQVPLYLPYHPKTPDQNIPVQILNLAPDPTTPDQEYCGNNHNEVLAPVCREEEEETEKPTEEYDLSRMMMNYDYNSPPISNDYNELLWQN